MIDVTEVKIRVIKRRPNAIREISMRAHFGAYRNAVLMMRFWQIYSLLILLIMNQFPVL